MWYQQRLTTVRDLAGLSLFVNREKCTKERCTRYTKEYLNALKALGCNKLFIYTNQDYYKNYYDWSQLDYPIWLADYEGDPNYDCVIQQYSSSGKVNGI